MALETPKSKSEIKGNITSLETRIKNQEKLIKSYEAIVDNLNSKITTFQRFVNIEKLLKVETDTDKISNLNTEKATLINKYPILTGKSQAAVELEIVSLEREKKDRQKDLDKEIAVLDEDKLNLRDHKAIDSKRPFAWMSKRGLKTAGLTAGLVFGTWLAHDVFQGKNDKDSKDDKNKTEQTTPVAPPKDTPKDNDKAKEKPGDRSGLEKDLDKLKKDLEKENELKDLRNKNKNLVDRLKNTKPKIPGKQEDFTEEVVDIDGVKYQRLLAPPDNSLVKPNGDYRKVGREWYKKIIEKQEDFTEVVVDIDGVKYQKLLVAPDPSLVKPFGDYRKVGDRKSVV